MAQDMGAYRRKLLDRGEALRREDELAAADRTPVELDRESVGRLSRMDALQVQAMAQAQKRRCQSQKAAIDAGLKRIEEGEYGYCLVCGDDIAEARLAPEPAVPLCIECARNRSTA